MSREEKILKIGSKTITILTTITTFTLIFTYIYHHSDISTGIIALLLMAGIFITLLLNYVLGSLWFIIVYIAGIIISDLKDEDGGFFDFKL